MYIQVHFPSSSPKISTASFNRAKSLGVSLPVDASSDVVVGVTNLSLPSSSLPSQHVPPIWASYFSQALNDFCLWRLFQLSLALMLLIQSSLLLPCCWTQAKGYLLALTVT
jgi:hypothetical protein